MTTVQLPPFAKLLRRYRLDAGLTQEELAERANLSARAISDLERGVKTRPHRVTVELLADALGLTDDDRVALLHAIPPVCGPRTDTVNHWPEWFAPNSRPPLMEAVLMHCSQELRRALEGVVGFYVGEESRDQQINIAVVVFSVGTSIMASEQVESDEE